MATITTAFRMVDNVSGPMNNVRNSVERTSKGFESMAGKLVAVNSALDLMGKGVQIVKQMASAVGRFVSDAGEYQSLLANLTVATGDATQAQKEFADLKEFAAHTPFDLPGVVQASTMFHAVGIEAKNIIPTIRMLGDAAAGDSDKFNRMVMNYMQIMSVGKASAMDMRQFASMGLPVMQMMQDMGITGQATAAQVQEMFIKMTSEGGQFYNSMGLNAGTLSGGMSNLRDSFQQLSAEIGDQFLPLISELTTTVSGLFEAVKETSAFKDLMSGIQNMIDGIKNNLDAIIATIIQVGTIAMSVLTGITILWSILHWQTTLIILVIINIVRAMYDMNKATVENANSIGQVVNVIAQAGQSMGKVIGFVIGLFNALSDIVYNVVAVIHNSFASLGEFIANVFSNPFDAIMRGLLDFASGIVDIIGTIGGVADAVLHTNISQSMKGLSSQIQNFKDKHFDANVKFDKMDIKEVGNVADAARKGGEYGYELGSMISNGINQIANNTMEMSDMQTSLPIDSNGNLKVSVQNDELKIDNEWAEQMERSAREKYKEIYNTITPTVSIGNVELNNASDMDVFMDKIATSLVEFANSTLN